MELVLLLLRLILAGILGLAGVGKLLDPEGGEKVMSDFGVPKGLARSAAIALSVFEIVLSLSLLSIATSWAAAVATFLLMLVFIGGMIWQIAKGRAPDCHCFGQLHSEPVSKKSVVRNVLFAIPALALAASGPSNQGFSLGDSQVNSIQSLFGLLTVAMFVAVLLYLRRISGQQQLILRRIELLGALSQDGSAVERTEAGAPTDSLPIGALFPDFSLRELSGKTVSLNNVLNGKPVLFFFVDSNCNPCSVLLPEIEEWQKELKGDVDFVFASRGTAKDNQDKFGSDKLILLQKDQELAEPVFAKWTPSALLVNSEGRVASHLAIGDTAIRTLVAGIRSNNLNEHLAHVPFSKNGVPRMIGQTVPEFSLEDTSGNKITNESFRDQQTLVTFWSPSCPHCTELVKQLQDPRELGLPSDLGMVIFSNGDRQDHSELNLNLPIVLDKDFRISTSLGAMGTPSAVLIDGTGRIVSETAIGAPNIWSLVRRTKV